MNTKSLKLLTAGVLVLTALGANAANWPPYTVDWDVQNSTLNKVEYNVVSSRNGDYSFGFAFVGYNTLVAEGLGSTMTFGNSNNPAGQCVLYKWHDGYPTTLVSQSNGSQGFYCQLSGNIVVLSSTK